MKIFSVILGILTLLVLSVYGFVHSEKFGALPSGERLARIQKSVNYQKGAFQNLQQTDQFTSEDNPLLTMLKGLFQKDPNIAPKNRIPVVKTALSQLPMDKNLYVWFGHSGYLLIVDGKRYLIDPTLVSASPVWFFGKAFAGLDYFKPEHIPPVDVLIISHDHWDHLDFETVQAIKERVGKVVMPLGVDAHFERWGWDSTKLAELDWHDTLSLSEGVSITALPARHFSGRGLTSNQSLWASFMLQTPSKTIYIGGDSGYGDFYADIAEQFPKIDFAILENGQYSENWAQIHDLPNQLPRVVNTLKPQKFVTVHNSKYILANHAWNEPMALIAQHSLREKLPLYTPKIGEIMDLDADSAEKFEHWWEKVN